MLENWWKINEKKGWVRAKLKKEWNTNIKKINIIVYFKVMSLSVKLLNDRIKRFHQFDKLAVKWVKFSKYPN